MKRFLAVVLALCLVLGMGSVSAFAEEMTGWQEEANLPVAAVGNFSASMGDKIYVMGGLEETKASKSMFSMDKSGLWKSEPNMPEARVNAASIAVGNKIYVIGGSADTSLGDVKTTVMIYDTISRDWSYGATMPTQIQYSAIASVNNKIYIFGGRSTRASDVKHVYIYDIESNAWKAGTPLPQAMYVLGAAPVEDKIFVMGGFITSKYPSAENGVRLYNTKDDTWEVGPTMPFATAQYCTVYDNEKILIAGGYDKQPISKVAMYDIDRSEWRTLPDMPASIFAGGAAIMNDKLYVMSGYKNSARSNSVFSLQLTQPTKQKLSVLLSESETVQLSTSYNLENSTNFTWTSADETIATVNANGKVTAVALGETEITVQNADATFKESIPVKVLEMADEQRLAVHLKPEENAKLYLTEDPSTVTWTSLDESVVTVGVDGQLTAVAKGLAIVKAELDGETYLVYVRVNG